MIDAQHRRAVERHVLDELDEGRFHPVEAAVVIEVFGIDVGDDRQRAIEPQERTIAFVGFHHHPVRRAKAGVRAVGIDDAAVDDRGIDPARIEQRRDHRGSGGLAVGAGHGHGVLEPHQLRQHFRTAHHRHARFEGGDDFGIFAPDGGGSNDHGRAFDVLRLVADHHRDAALAQAFDDIAFGDVRTLHRIAHVVHDFGNAGHADAADADEMDRADICADTLHARTPVLRGTLAPSATCSEVAVLPPSIRITS
jgi:hypothetical protein